MGKEYHTSYIPYIEETIKKSPELCERFKVKTSIPFKEGDYVECTFIHGLFRVVGISTVHRTVKVSAINNSSKYFTLSEDFVRLYEGNPKAVKVLFEP